MISVSWLHTTSTRVILETDPLTSEKLNLRIALVMFLVWNKVLRTLCQWKNKMLGNPWHEVAFTINAVIICSLLIMKRLHRSTKTYWQNYWTLGRNLSIISAKITHMIYKGKIILSSDFQRNFFTKNGSTYLRCSMEENVSQRLYSSKTDLQI